MSTFNDFFKNDADYLQFIEDDNKTNKIEKPLSQVYNPVPSIEKALSEQKNRTKHHFTNFNAGFVM